MNPSATRHPRHLPRKAAVVLLSMGIVTALATPAFAHHPDLTGTVACAADGQQVVTWTVTNSETAEGSNRTMILDEVTVSSGTVSSIEVGTEFPPQPDADSTRAATTTLPGNETGEITLTVRADWDNDGPQDEERSVSVTLLGTCTEPVVPTTTTTTTEPPPTTTTTQAPVALVETPTTTTTLPTEVLGEVLVAPEAVAPVATLPATGAPIGALLLLGAVALTLGLVITRLGKEKTAP